MTRRSIDVSVIIPTREITPELRACLQSVRSQSYPKQNIEIIIANRSNSVSAHRVTKQFDATLMQHAGNERSAQRNAGAKLASGKYLLFLDADMTISPAVISSCVAAFEKNPNLSGIHIPEIIQSQGWFGKVRNFERSFYTGTCIDAMRCIRTDIFRRIGGFDMHLWGGEDWDLDKRLGGREKGYIISEPLYHDERNSTLQSYIQKKSYYTDSLLRYSNKWGGADETAKKQLGFWYRFFGVFFEKGKWKKVLQFPHLFLGVLFLRFLVGCTYIQKRYNIK